MTKPHRSPQTRSRIDVILADAAWARRVVKAALEARETLYGPDPTMHGEDACLAARATLDAALEES